MGSREKDQTMPHQPLLSSLVVRATDSGGGGGTNGASGGDYEPGEVRRDHPPTYSRSNRFNDGHGYRMRTSSLSPVRRRPDRRYSPDFDHSVGPPRGRGRGYDSGRGPGKYRDDSHHYGCGRGGARFNERGFERPGYDQGSLRGEAVPRNNNPNVRPREGDWICSDPSCNNMNFARREVCNNCKKPRFSPSGSPRRGFAGPSPPLSRRFPGPPSDRSPGRIMNGYRSPPRGWMRNDPRDLRAVGPPSRHEGRFVDPPLRRDRPDYPEDDVRDRNRFDRPLPPDWVHRDRGRENFFNERKGYDRRQQSPPLSAFPPRGQWARDIRDRSRSPIRGGAPPKDYRRDMYMERGRDDRRGMGRGGY